MNVTWCNPTMCPIARERWFCATILIFLFFGFQFVDAADSEPAFAQANRQYEEGQYRQAARTYQDLLEKNGASAPLLFNLGNAWLKGGQLGRARVCYLLALELSPRDRDIRANLRFLRQTLGADPVNWRQRWATHLRWFNLNEWTLAALVLLWTWLGLLAAKHFQPKLGPPLRFYTRIVVMLLGFCLLAFAVTVWERYSHATVIMITPNPEVRRGPLAESQVYFSLKDGVMIRAIDEQFGWREVMDGSGRSGWLKTDQTVLIKPGLGPLTELLHLPFPK